MATFTSDKGKQYIDGKEVVKGWESWNGCYWFAVELDREQDSIIDGKVVVGDKIWFGYAQVQDEEWGYFSEGEIESLGKRAWKIKAFNLPFAGRRS